MVKKKGVLCYDRESGRYDIYFGNGSYYGGLHCGDCFDVEMDGDLSLIHISVVLLQFWELFHTLLPLSLQKRRYTVAE